MKEIANPKAIHICNSHEPMLKPKIAKEYGLPTLRKKMSSKFEKKNDINERMPVSKTAYTQWRLKYNE